MYCPKCGNANVEKARFCARCGAPLPVSPEQRQSAAQPDARLDVLCVREQQTNPPDVRRRGKGKVLPVALAVVAVALLAIGVVVGLRALRGGPTGVRAAEEVFDNYSIRLTADRTDLLVGGDGAVTLTVSLPPEDLSDSVEILSEDGKALLTVAKTDFTENNYGGVIAHADLDVDTSSDGAVRVHAVSGERRSSELAFFVTPQITESQVMESIEVGADLCEWLAENYDGDEKDYEEIAKAAEVHLQEDPRVGGVNRVGTSVYYNTTSLVAGAFEAEPYDDLDSDEAGTLASSKDETSGARASDAASLVAKTLPHLAAQDLTRVTVKDTVEANDSRTSGRTFKENTDATSLFSRYGVDKSTVDPEAGPAHLSAGNTTTNGNAIVLIPKTNVPNWPLDGTGAKIEDKVRGDGHDSVREGDEAVRTILARELSNAGTIIMLTHGGVLEKPNGEVCAFVASLFQTKESTAESYKSVMEAKLQSFAKMDFEIQGETESSDSKFGTFYQQFYGKVGEEENWRIYDLGEGKNGIIRGHIIMTSTFLMERYADTGFDNAVFCLAACDCMGYMTGFTWLLHNGCQMVMGLPDHAMALAAAWYVNVDIDNMLEDSESSPWRTMSRVEMNTTKPIAYQNYGNEQFFYAGTSSLTGKVCYYDENSGSNDTPCKGATVKANLFLNQSFQKKATVKTGDDGSFSFEGLRSGLYVLTVDDGKGHSNTVSIIVDEESVDGGTVLLDAPASIDITVVDSDGSCVTQAGVVLRAGDESLYEADLVTNDAGDQLFRVIVASPDHDETLTIYVEPQDNRHVKQQVEFNLPKGASGTFEVTVTLVRYGDIAGMVYTAETGEPLDGVEVGCEGASGLTFATTTAAGSYTLEHLEPGDYTLTYKKAGYQIETQIVKVTDGDVEAPDVVLIPEEIDVEAQIKLIASLRSRWELERYLSLVQSYTICDLDHNGRLEIIAAEQGGSGNFTYAKILEVSNDITTLEVRYDNVDGTEDFAPDWASTNYESIPTYEKDGDYLYLFHDNMRNGRAQHIDQTYEVKLKDSVLSIEPICSAGVTWSSTSGETHEWHDGSGNTISESEYDAVPDNLYGSMKSSSTYFRWVKNEELGGDLEAVLTQSWEGFTNEPQA